MEASLFDEEEMKSIVCGSDEAGRGPLAGPVVAAAVILPGTFPVEILADSKKLSEKKRKEAERIIKEKAVWAVSSVSHRTIDRINILNASMLAMKKAYETVRKKMQPDILLVDGNRTPDVDIPCQAIVKGDGKIPEIMAASILAKCERDRLMELADRKWPEYGYGKHKGYPTKAHMEAIIKNGPSPIERMSFHIKDDGEKDLF